MNLNMKHRLFVEAWNGDNHVEAMQVAGYIGAPNYLKQKAKELLRQPEVLDAIRDRSRYTAKTKNTIADREERQQFWTNIMRNEDPHIRPEIDPKTQVLIEEPNIPMNQRLKASELLGKSEIDFIERVDLTGTVTVTDVITQAYKITDDELDAIEAEYYEKIETEKQVSAQEDNDQDQDSGVDVHPNADVLGEPNGGEDNAEGIGAFI